jgi:hypothetical protein
LLEERCEKVSVATLTLANAWMTAEHAAALSRLAQLWTEKEQLARKVAKLEQRLTELQISHELCISVSEDISSRLPGSRGWRGRELPQGDVAQALPNNLPAPPAFGRITSVLWTTVRPDG